MSFEKFTDKARKVLVLAQDEARSLHQPYVGTEHILLGLIQEKDGLAAQALDPVSYTHLGGLLVAKNLLPEAGGADAPETAKTRNEATAQDVIAEPTPSVEGETYVP